MRQSLNGWFRRMRAISWFSSFRRRKRNRADLKHWQKRRRSSQLHSETLEARQMMAADLIVTNLQANGDDLVVTYDVTTESAAEFDVGVYRSADGVTPDALLFSQRVTDSNLRAVGTGHQLDLTADFTDVAQDYQLIVVLDSSSEITEISEANNSSLFAGGIFQSVDGTVHVHGTGAADSISISEDTDLTVGDGSNTYVFDPQTVSGIHVRLQGGDDSISATGYTIDTEIFAGAGNDTLDELSDAPLSWHGGAGWDSPEVLDNSDADYVELGSWSDHSSSSAFNGTQRQHSAGTGTNTATWTWNSLTEDGYEVFVTWDADALAATNATYEVFDGTTSLGTYSVNQTAQPTGNSVSGCSWHRLGVFQSASGTLKVVLSDDANGLVLADAARLVSDNAPTTTGIPNVDVLQDSSDSVFNLSGYFNDPDLPLGDALTFSVQSNDNSSVVSSSLLGDTLTLSYLTGQHGTANLTLRATDVQGLYVETNLQVNIQKTIVQTLGAEADAMVQSGYYANTNYGGWSYFQVRDHATSADLDLQAFLRFDLSQISGDISNAKIRLYPSNVGTAGQVHTAWLIPDDTWDESTLTWNTRPGVGYQLGSWAVVQDQWVELDVTDAIRDILTSGGSDQKFSLRISSPNANSQWVYYTSRDYQGLDGGQPELVLTGAFNNSAAPIGTDDAYVADNNGTALVVSQQKGVLANDTDMEIYDLSAVVETGPAHGTLSLAADGSFTYTADTGYVGTDTFTYRVADPDYQSDPVTVTINVKALTVQTLGAEADAYVANGDYGDNLYGTWGSLFVRHHSSDINYRSQSFLRFDLSQVSGEISNAKIRLYPYNTSAPGQVHTAWLVPDDTWDETTVTGNTKPPASYELGTWTVTEGQWVELEVTDAIRDILASGGTDQKFSVRIWAVEPDAKWVYYRSKEHAGVDGGQPELVLTGAFDNSGAPVGTDDSYVADNNGTALVVSQQFGVLANDTDVDIYDLTAVLEAGPAHGTLSLAADGSFTYTADTGYVGTDAFTYRVADPDYQSDPVTVAIHVKSLTVQTLGAAEDSFVFSGSNANVSYNSWGNLGVRDHATNNDADNQAFLKFDLSQISGDISQATFQIMPTAGTGSIHSAWLVPNDVWNEETLTWNARPGVSYELGRWNVVAGQLVELDVTDAIKEILASGGADQAFSIRIHSLNADSIWGYYYGADYPGLDNIPPKLILTGTFDNSAAPVGTDDSYVADNNGTALVVSQQHGVLSNDTDAEIYDLSAVLETGPAHGTLSLAADGSFIYTADTGYVGIDTFTYRVADPDYQSDPVTVIINVRTLTVQTIGASDDALVASANYNMNNYGDWTTLYVRDHASNNDYDNQAYLKFDLSQFTGEISQAKIRIMPTTGTGAVHGAWLVPDDSWSESTIVGYQRPGVDYEIARWTVTAGQWVEIDVTDLVRDILTSGGADQALSIKIASVNADSVFSAYYSKEYTGATGQPELSITGTFLTIGVEDSFSTNQETTLTVPASEGVLANDTDDPEATLLASLDATAMPEHGTVILNADGSFEYTPDAGFYGTDSFRYFASLDGHLSDPITVMITVNGRPMVADDQYLVNENDTLIDTVAGILANDSDPENETLTVELVTPPASQLFTLNADGTFEYTLMKTWQGMIILSIAFLMVINTQTLPE